MCIINLVLFATKSFVPFFQKIVPFQEIMSNPKKPRMREQSRIFRVRMEAEYKKLERKSSIFKKMERYLSLSRRARPSKGCFSVYVGPEKQRFVIKTEFANHPLFKMLLDDAEMEYGFTNEGPLLIPCEVDLFCKVLAEMDSGKDFDDDGFAYGSCSPFNPARRLGKRSMAKGCGSYGLLTPPRLHKINNI